MTVINMLLLGILYTTKVRELNYSLITNLIWNHSENVGNNYSVKVKRKTIQAFILPLLITQQLCIQSANTFKMVEEICLKQLFEKVSLTRTKSSSMMKK